MRPSDWLHIHIKNGDTTPHRFQVHGVLNSIDSDDSWPCRPNFRTASSGRNEVSQRFGQGLTPPSFLAHLEVEELSPAHETRGVVHLGDVVAQEPPLHTASPNLG